MTPPPIASTSKGDPTASNPGPDSPGPHQAEHQRLLDQCEILERLAEGEGIQMDEWDGVVEKCYVCSKFMLEAVFKAHSQDCWHMSDSDEESQVDEWGKE